MKGSHRQDSRHRPLKVRVKTAKGRKVSSQRWLQRQLNDPYVIEAKRQGYRSRAAFKLIELNEKYHFLAPGQRVIDLGAAPGGWSQVVSLLCHTSAHSNFLVAVDKMEMDPLPGVTFLQLDFLEENADVQIKSHLQDQTADVVLSDMAAFATGHAGTDHLRTIALAQSAFQFACEVLAPEGCFVTKVLQGGTQSKLLAEIKQRFRQVKHAKPPSSRKESSEMYLIALGFRP